MSDSTTHWLPAEFEARMRELIGQEAGPFLAALRDPPMGLRVNTLKLSPAEFMRASPVPLAPLTFPAEGFLVDPDDRPGRHPYHDAGLYYLQDPGAMAVGAMANAHPGELVLDLAAAPGGKAAHMGAYMAGAGVLVANDVHAGRARELASNLERLGVRNAVVTAETPERLVGAFGPIFDRVLLDAPCSGESMFHKSAAAVADWSRSAVEGCARRQGEVLEHASRTVRRGGLLVYSTCTFSPEENEEAIARFLAAHPDFTPVPLDAPAGARPGEPAWVSPEHRRDDLGLTVRLWPHRVPGAGHFVAALRRAGEGAAAAGPGEAGAIGQSGPLAVADLDDPSGSSRRRGGGGRGRRYGSADAKAAGLAWEEFRETVVPGFTVPPGFELVTRGETLSAVASGTPPLRGLRVLAAGIRLGDLRKGRFDPSHSLALALNADESVRSVSLPAASDDVNAYLRGETLRADCPDGWIVVKVDGFPLGWGKCVRGVLKNHYPKGLRRR